MIGGTARGNGSEARAATQNSIRAGITASRGDTPCPSPREPSATIPSATAVLAKIKMIPARITRGRKMLFTLSSSTATVTICHTRDTRGLGSSNTTVRSPKV